MKKSKLWALAAPAAAIATITPVMLTTSCNKNNPTLEISIFDIETYVPKGTQLTGAYTNAEMTNKYYEFIKTNPLYLAEDLAKGWDITSHNEEIKGSIKVWINSIDPTNHKLSFKASYDLYGDYGSGSGSMAAEEEVTNISYTANWKDERFQINIGWTEAEFIAAKDWSARVYYKIQETGGAAFEQEKKASDSSTESEKKEIYSILDDGIDSYYMKKCTHKTE